MKRTRRALLVVVLACGLLPRIALAHGMGSRYELSLPEWLFLAGGAAVVVVSFGLVSVFAGREGGSFSYRNYRLSETPLRLATSDTVVAAVRVAVVALVTVAVLAGFFGPQDANENLLTNLVWVGFWVGYTFSVVLVGNTWPAINPWRTVYDWISTWAGTPSIGLEYRLGDYPAVVAFLAFAWLEVVGPISKSPRGMAFVVLGYSAYVWGGMVLFGAETWLAHGDPFTRVFGFLGKFAPVDPGTGEIRMYGVGLVTPDSALHSPGALTLVVALLYTVTFDGFIGTPLWVNVALSAPKIPIRYGTTTVLMFLGVALFVAVYVSVALAMKALVDSDLSTLYLARRFAPSLLPIAIVYQLAHFYVFLLVQGQFLLLSLSDPFGLGWNLLLPAGFSPSPGLPFLSVTAVWQSQVALIVLGHVVAVWVAHHVALDVFGDRYEAVKSQLPMMALMVVYTMLSLWILNQPVVDPPLP